MGFVVRQSSHSIILSVLSLLLGVVNNLYIYPKFKSENGFVQSVMSAISLFLPIILWGLPPVINKYHHLFAKRNYQGFFRFSLQWFIVSLLIFTALYWTILPEFIQWVSKRDSFLAHINKNKFFIFLLVVVVALRMVIAAFANINRNVVSITFFNKLFFNKIILPIIVLLAGLQMLSEKDILLYLILGASFTLLIFLLYAIKRKWIDFKKNKTLINKETRKEMLHYSSYSIMNQTGMLMAFSIDIIMVNQYLGNASAGVYSIFLFLAGVVKVPIDAVGSLVTPLVSSAFVKNDLNQVKEYYKKLSIGMYVTMLCLFLPILVAIPDILLILNDQDFEVGKLIFLFVSIGILFNGSTFLNSTIIEQSSYFRFNLIFIVVLAFLNVGLTFWFIKYLFAEGYQSAGAACATAVSLVLFNILKTVFVYSKFRMQPFSLKHFKVSLFAMVYILIIYYIPFGTQAWLNLILKIFMLFIFILPIYFLKISDEINKEVENKLSMILNLFK